MKVNDATKTVTLRNQAIAESKRRFKRLSKSLATAFSPLVEVQGILVANERKKPKDKSLGRITRHRSSLQLSAPILSRVISPLGQESVGTAYRFLRTSSVADFEIWLAAVIAKELLQPTIPVEQKWLSTYLFSAYSKGATSTRSSISAQIANIGKKLPEQAQVLTHTAHVSRSTLIFERNFNGIEGISTSMKNEMRKILADGILRGKSSREIAIDLDERIGVGMVRANRLARTEIIEAHQEASVQETEILEAELGIEFNMEWITTKDGRQRDTHNARDGKIYTKEKVRALLGEPNCRCAVVPSIKL